MGDSYLMSYCKFRGSENYIRFLLNFIHSSYKFIIPSKILESPPPPSFWDIVDMEIV